MTDEELLIVCKALMSASIPQEWLQDEALIEAGMDIAEKYIKEVTS